MQYISASNLKFDAFLLTGDIADDGSREAYEFVAKYLKQFNKKILFINGKHDNKETMLNTFSQFSNFEFLNTFSFTNYALIGIDSCVVGKDYGFITDSAMQNIKDNLDILSLENKKCILVLHHHPILVNTPLIDDCPLTNGDALIHLFSTYKSVLLLLSGHFHNDYIFHINEKFLALSYLSLVKINIIQKLLQ